MSNEVTSATGRRLMTIDEAIRHLREDPAYEDLVRDAYLGRDVGDSIRRFAASAEFHELLGLIGANLGGSTVVDVGAGTGIASAAFRGAGAGRVIAVEPDGSDEVGRGAMERGNVDVEILDAFGEDLPLPTSSVDVVYARQVLHHASDLERLVSELARVLRPGGTLLATREHVVDDDDQLEAFLTAHPVHRLAGGEYAYSLDRYRGAIERSGLILVRTLGPWDSVINAFPAVGSNEELRRLPRDRLARRFGILGRVVGTIPAIQRWEWSKIDRPDPGRLYTFLARKP